MKCPKCGASITKDDAFCPECGSKADFEKIEKKSKKHEEKEPHHKATSNKWVKPVSIIGIILIVGVIFIFAIPLPYYPTEVYSISEPYTASETYYEEDSYQDTECEWKYPSYNKDQEMEWVGERIKVICTITNFEDEAVSFSYTLWTGENSGDTDDDYGPRSVTVGPGQTVTKDSLLDNGPGGHYGCSVSASQIKECHLTTKFKSVPKQRTVTKYKNVDKERKVTRYAPLFQRWTGQVNWYFREGEA
jgi:hypothetical protein|tara:strand:+ start:1338 stop:2078 length:741 start_codon:yes stop_codon:yes gene_type:complete